MNPSFLSPSSCLSSFCTSFIATLFNFSLAYNPFFLSSIIQSVHPSYLSSCLRQNFLTFLPLFPTSLPTSFLSFLSTPLIPSFLNQSIYPFSISSFFTSFIPSLLHYFLPYSFDHSFPISFLHVFLPAFLSSFCPSFIPPCLLPSIFQSFLPSFSLRDRPAGLLSPDSLICSRSNCE